MPLFKTHSPSRASLTVPHSAPGSATSSRSASPSAPNTAMQDDTFRNVKLVEELLKAWNEHRQALAGCAKTGKRLAKAMCELGLGLDKTGVAGESRLAAMGMGSEVETDPESSADAETDGICFRRVRRRDCQMGEKGRQGVRGVQQRGRGVLFPPSRGFSPFHLCPAS